MVTVACSCGVNSTTLQCSDLSTLSLSAAGGLLQVDCPRLTSVRLLSSAQLSDIPLNLYLGLTRLSSLTIENTGLVQLQPSLFSGLSTLLSLLVRSNQFLSAIPESLFVDLTSLTSLTLSRNGLTELRRNIFSSFASSLVTLDISFNPQLLILPVRTFRGMTRLSTLIMNDLSPDLLQLDAGLLFNLTTLSSLTCSGRFDCTWPTRIQLTCSGQGSFVPISSLQGENVE
jgi:hypothetical protein